MTGLAKMVEQYGQMSIPIKKSDSGIVILGGRGMLGTDVAAYCRRQGVNARVFDLPDFDITKNEDLKKALTAASVVINCAAYTNVEKAESENDLAYAVNAAAVGRLGELAKNLGIWVLHISTDFVFDGRLERPYAETDMPNPINTYGRTKLDGEKLLADTGCKHCIMRLEWTYGRAGENFVTKLVKQAKSGRGLRVVDDQIGSPTATVEAAKAVYDLLSRRPQGIYHFANSGYASRYEMAAFILEKMNISVELSPCKSSEYKTAAQRPLNSRFCCDRIKSLLNEPIENWQTPLVRFLEQL